MASDKSSLISASIVRSFANSNELNSLPASVKSQLLKSVSKQSTNFAPNLTNKVDNKSNFLLNDIPNNLVGINNPVNTVSSNLSPRELADNLSPTVVNDLLPSSSTDLTSGIVNDFLNNLQGSFTTEIDVNQITSLVSSLSTSSISSGISSLLTQFSNNVLSGTNIPPRIS